MRRVFVNAVVLVLSLAVFAQESQIKTGPVIKFEETLLDFGVITQGDTVEHTFIFQNMGTQPLKILSARGSCGCTVPTYSKEEVRPGAKGEVVVRFNSAGKMGKQNKTVTLVTNALSNKTVVLTVRGTIKRKDTED
mgnify:FL=1